MAAELTDDIRKASSNSEKAEMLADKYESIHTEAFARGDADDSARIVSEMKDLYDNNEPLLQFSERHPARIDFIQHNTATFATTEETIEDVRRLNNKKSSGHDGMPNYLLRKLPFEFFVYITVLFNQCTHAGYFPRFWKMGSSPIY